MKHPRLSAGFTMLEVLISIVVIAFGLLGVAGLQAFAIKNNQSASMRITASTLAMDMVDRVHANWAAVNVEAPLVPAYNNPNVSDYGTAVSACTTASGCTNQQMAQNDLYEWAQLVAAALPNGQGIVCIDISPNDGVSATDPQCDATNSIDNYVVKIWWRDDRTATGDIARPQRFVWPFRP